MKIIAIYNIKGGVGKTATAVNLSFLASLDGANTLLWDLDPQGAASYYCRIKPKINGSEFPSLAIVVQKMVNADKSGVMFTANPFSSNGEQDEQGNQAWTDFLLKEIAKRDAARAAERRAKKKKKLQELREQQQKEEQEPNK